MMLHPRASLAISAACAALIRSPCHAGSRMARRRRRGDFITRGVMPCVIWAIAAMRLPLFMTRARSASVHSPAGENADTDSARPRRANSSATNPPMELPAKCGRSRPCSSR
jgi:hypothetical protein